MDERWLRRVGTAGLLHRFVGEAQISSCGQLRLLGDVRSISTEGPEGFPQYFCRRCVDIKAKERTRK